MRFRFNGSPDAYAGKLHQYVGEEVLCILEEDYVTILKGKILKKAQKGLDAGADQQELAKAEAKFARCHSEAARLEAQSKPAK